MQGGILKNFLEGGYETVCRFAKYTELHRKGARERHVRVVCLLPLSDRLAFLRLERDRHGKVVLPLRQR